MINRLYHENKISWSSQDFVSCIDYYLNKNCNDYLSSNHLCKFPLLGFVLDYNGDLLNCFYSKSFGNIYSYNSIDWGSKNSVNHLRADNVCVNCRGKVFCG